MVEAPPTQSSKSGSLPDEIRLESRLVDTPSVASVGWQMNVNVNSPQYPTSPLRRAGFTRRSLTPHATPDSNPGPLWAFLKIRLTEIAIHLIQNTIQKCPHADTPNLPPSTLSCIPPPMTQNPPNLRPDLARSFVPDTRRDGQPTIGMVSLGCPKALVDSERILTRLRAEGYAISPDYRGADAVIVNTCGFLDSAKAESLEAIGEALQENGRVIVTGCLGAEPDYITGAHPRVLAVTGPHQYEAVLDAVHKAVPPNGVVRGGGGRVGAGPDLRNGYQVRWPSSSSSRGFWRMVWQTSSR